MIYLTIIVGFAMMTLGFALLLLGEVPFVAGKRISAVRSRLIGGVLVSFLPLAWGVLTVVRWVFGPDAVDGPVVMALVFSVCCLATFAILFRVMIPRREPRNASTASAKKNPVAEAEEPRTHAAPEPKAAGKKPRKPTGDNANPFDFN